jgi:Protein of Unknown function (DUF2604)
MTTIIFIVNGVDLRVEIPEYKKLSVAKETALNESNNISRSYIEWEIHNDEGYMLDDSKTVYDLGIVDGDRVFLNLKVGAGG